MRMHTSKQQKITLSLQKSKLVAIGGGILSAMCLMAPTAVPNNTWLLILACFANLPIFMVGLGYGIYPAILTCLVATLALISAIGSIEGASVIQGGLIFVTLSAVPVCLLVRQSLLKTTLSNNQTSWYPVSYLLIGLVISAIALQFVTSIVFNYTGISNVENLHADIEKLSSHNANEIYQAIGRIMPYVSGIIASSWMLMLIINGVIAQKVLQLINRNLRPMPSLTEINLPNILTIVLATCGLIAAVLAGNSVGMLAANTAVILTVPFLLVGMCTVHLLCNTASNKKILLLVPFYLFIIIFPVAILLIILMGIFEPWLKLRARFAQLDKK